MNEHLDIKGPAVGSEQLVDVYLADRGKPSPWIAISDQVMGGISTAEVRQVGRHGAACTCLSGRTRLENNGGFAQMKLKINPDELSADFRGLFIELCGPAHDYNLNVKTTQLAKPWQSFRCTLALTPQWTRFVVPYAELQAHRTDAKLDPMAIRSVAVVAIGTAFDVDVCVRQFGFYRWRSSHFPVQNSRSSGAGSRAVK